MSGYTKEVPGGLALVARMFAKEGKRDQLLEAIRDGVALAAEHEPGGPLSVSIHVSPSNPDLVVLYEHWPNQAALAEHRANFERIPAYAVGRARLGGLLAKPVELVEAATHVETYAREQPAADVVRRLVDAERDRDLDAYAACLAQAVEVRINGQLRADSRESQRAITEATLAAFPDWERETLGLHADGNVVGLRWRGSGTHSAPWGGVPASGNRVEFHGTSWCEVTDGLITRIWIDMDMAGPVRQMTAGKEKDK